jgi:lipoprotein NlpD
MLGLALLALAGCAGKPVSKAPVEDRRPPPRAVAATASAPAAAASAAAPAEAAKALPGSENAGKPGYYTVKPGDMLIRIALENGQNWRDVQRWNGLENPNLIEVGQVLRVLPPPPPDAAAGTVARPVQPAGRIDSKPLDPRAPASATASASAASAPASAATSVVAQASSAPAPAPAPARPAREGDEGISWSWPAAGPVATPFDEARSKGLAITGKAGDPVLAAADGRVVYAGSGLRGYGNLVIVKHNATYLTAYAHNQTLLVKDEQVVRRGQKIAEMGSSDAERVQLHFEIRRQGVPIDPQRLLPPR